VLLPGYIGWSAREGSGIWDPIAQLSSLDKGFYRMTSDLAIDVSSLRLLLEKAGGRICAVLIINYFGFTDIHASSVSELVRQHGGFVIEDNAHGFFSYHCRADDLSDVTFFSLHKMFPFAQGGSVLVKSANLADIALKGCRDIGEENPWDYDWGQISIIRRTNFQAIDELINCAPDYLSFFRPLRNLRSLSDVPQSYPVYLVQGNRDYAYQALNNMGFGVVSLYHTLIEPLHLPDHEDALRLSRKILNLPVHQDVDRAQYANLLSALKLACQHSL